MPLYSDITNDGNYPRIRRRFEAYRAYLRSVEEYLPEETKAFVLSDWYYGADDFNRCPHDAWLESCEIRELYSGERKEIREVDIRPRLLSASHEGHIFFTYRRVFGYDMRFDPSLRVWDNETVPPKHDDWLSDEISLASEGNVLHEIRFRSGCIWRIEARSIAYSFVPLETGSSEHQ